uniref:Variant surface glycoprotein n=1 Tax=Trypanosoma brucei TaxID=5691 RepID=A0A1V0FXR8_9TRYP|nr:variant surface glycoprotein [Trypanosoma brucei]
MKPLLQLAIALIIAPTFVRGAGENANEFRDICVLNKLLTTKIPNPEIGEGQATNKKPVSTNVAEVMSEVLQLNLTVVEAAKEKVLQDKTEYADMSKIKGKNEIEGYFEKIDNDELAALRKAYAKGRKGEGADDAFMKKFALPLKENIRQKFRPVLAALTLRARSIKQKITDAEHRIGQSRKNVRQALLQALYGPTYQTVIWPTDTDPDQEVKPFNPEKPFPWEGASREATCKAASATDKTAGAALAADLVCLCSGGNSGDADKARHCTQTDTATVAEVDSTTPATKARTNYIALEKACDTVADSQNLALSPAALAEAVATVLGKLGANCVTLANGPDQTSLAQTRKNYLGIYVVDTSAAACDAAHATPKGTAGKGVCVDYTEQLKTGKGIPWVTQVRKAAAGLQEIASEFSQVNALLAQLQSTPQQMEAILLMGLSSVTHQPSADTTASSGPAVTQQNKCKNPPNKTKEGCAATGCDFDFDSEKKECKPKEEEEKTNTAARTGAAGASNTEAKRCSDKKSEGDCKSPDCKLEGETCKNSSILVNKRFALIATVFVSLVVFYHSRDFC